MGDALRILNHWAGANLPALTRNPAASALAGRSDAYTPAA
ncbi:hypothetical protein MPQ_2492 [Methylovorus sp. MP688]|nr:hypothetical protein MPQ_2492 [Methylovorus sp. MP688]